MMKINKSIITLLLGLALGAVLAFAARSRVATSVNGTGSASGTNSSAASKSDSVVLACPGRVEGVSEAINIGAGIDGVIAEIRVKEGETVAAGQIVAVINRDELIAQLSEARAAALSLRAARERLLRGGRDEAREKAIAETAAAKAMLEQAEARHQRYERLFEQGVVSADVRDETLRNLKVAEANLAASLKNEKLVKAEPLEEEREKADAEVKAADERIRLGTEMLAKRQVTSPVAGTVLRTNMKVGETYSTFTPQPIITVADTSRLRVRAEVDERDISNIFVGQRAVISGESLGEKKITGRVSLISSQMGRKKVRTGDPAEKSDRDVLEVLVDLEEKDRALIVGLRVTVQFEG
jgi:multidrug resistance efflux pump